MIKLSEQEARTSPLVYYSSKCTAHGTNILAIAVASFAYVEAITFFSGFGRIIANSIMPAFVIVGFHQIVRLLVWARLTQIVLVADIEEVKEKWKKEIPDHWNQLHKLDVTCQTYFKNDPKTKSLSRINRIVINKLWVLLVIGELVIVVLILIQIFILK